MAETNIRIVAENINKARVKIEAEHMAALNEALDDSAAAEAAGLDADDRAAAFGLAQFIREQIASALTGAGQRQSVFGRKRAGG